jgi:5-methylcytosine-specific restriction endonuclease McrA
MAWFEDALVIEGPLAHTALLLDGGWDRAQDRRALLQLVMSCAREDAALRLRFARLLLWMKATDVTLVDYPNWSAFCEEHSIWKRSRQRDYERLAEGGLDLIRKLWVRGAIPATWATRATKELAPDASTYDQALWFEKISHDPVHPRHRSRLVEVAGKNARIVEEACEGAKIFIGWSAPLAKIHDYVIDCWEKQLTSDQILEAARAVPPRPARLDQPPPQWESDPTQDFVGDWIEPRNQEHCMELMAGLRRRIEQRKIFLGAGYARIKEDKLWRRTHFRSLEQFCVEGLGLDQRTLERYADEARTVLGSPEARKAIENGLDVDRALFAVERAWGGESIDAWLDLVRRMDCPEMERARELQERIDHAYARQVEMAKQVESIIATAKSTGIGAAADEAARVGGDAAATAEHLLLTRDPTRIGTVRVALRDSVYRGPSAPPSAALLIPPKLLPAARWFVETVQIPKEYGVRATVVHDCYCCQNPRCRRITIRVHTHHIDPQELGGSDDPWNLIALCPSCHLRGIHSDRMRLVRIGDWLVWSWPGGGVALMWSPMEV